MIRDDNRHFSSGILIHQRTRDDKKSFANSVGCLGLTEEALNEMIKALNIRTFNGQHVGLLIVDRSGISQELYETYAGYYKNSISYISSAKFRKSAIEIRYDCLDEPVDWGNLCDAIKEIAETGKVSKQNIKDIEKVGKYIDDFQDNLYYHGN